MAQNPQGDSLWNWLGRQVGHVKKAVTTDVTKPKPTAAQPTTDGAKPQATSEPATASASPIVPQVIYRDEKAEEVEMPDQPGVKLRRTIIDEVIVEEQKKNEP
jgi:hypothetical protein